MAASFARACCERGERCLVFAFEESPDQIVRNMRSIGIDLGALVDRGLLRFHAARPTLFGLETHLATMHRAIREHDPTAVIVDPISNLGRVGDESEVTAMLMRLVDWIKSRGVTAMFTSLTAGDSALERTDVGVSSLIDTWFLLKSIESNGERNRVLYVLKSRGMAHSNQIREFLLTPQGIELQDVYLGADGGSARAELARARSADDEDSATPAKLTKKGRR
jgi:circadian clock protein KaiC